jgi:hypothetical protein
MMTTTDNPIPGQHGLGPTDYVSLDGITTLPYGPLMFDVPLKLSDLAGLTDNPAARQVLCEYINYCAGLGNEWLAVHSGAYTSGENALGHHPRLDALNYLSGELGYLRIGSLGEYKGKYYIYPALELMFALQPYLKQPLLTGPKPLLWHREVVCIQDAVSWMTNNAIRPRLIRQAEFRGVPQSMIVALNHLAQLHEIFFAMAKAASDGGEPMSEFELDIKYGEVMTQGAYNLRMAVDAAREALPFADMLPVDHTLDKLEKDAEQHWNKQLTAAVPEFGEDGFMEDMDFVQDAD